jgi:hypothetical protein
MKNTDDEVRVSRRIHVAGEWPWQTHEETSMPRQETRKSASSSGSKPPGSKPPTKAGAPGGGAELWLVGINAGAALAIAAFVAALAGGPMAVRDVMWTLAVMGVCILLLCLAGYRSQQRPLRRYRPQGWSTATALNESEGQ